MSTFLELQTNVQDFVIDLPSKVQTAVPRLINNAIRSAQKKYNFRQMELVHIFTTVDNTFLLGSLDNFKEYRDQGPYLFNNEMKSRKLTTSNVVNVELAILQTTQGPPAFVTEEPTGSNNTSNFYIFPAPDTLSDFDDGNYRVVIPYYAYSVSLVNSSDTNWFTNNMDDYIIEKAVGEAFGLDWDNDAMAIHLQRADEKFKEAKKADKTKRIAGVNELVVLWQGGKTPPVRW